MQVKAQMRLLWFFMTQIHAANIAVIGVDMNEVTKQGLIYAVILIVGIAGGYFYMQAQSRDLLEQISKLEAQVAEEQKKTETTASEMKKASEAAAVEVQKLTDELASKVKMVEEQKAKIKELEAASE